MQAKHILDLENELADLKALMANKAKEDAAAAKLFNEPQTPRSKKSGGFVGGLKSMIPGRKRDDVQGGYFYTSGDHENLHIH